MTRGTQRQREDFTRDQWRDSRAGQIGQRKEKGPEKRLWLWEEGEEWAGLVTPAEELTVLSFQRPTELVTLEVCKSWLDRDDQAAGLIMYTGPSDSCVHLLYTHLSQLRRQHELGQLAWVQSTMIKFCICGSS